MTTGTQKLVEAASIVLQEFGTSSDGLQALYQALAAHRAQQEAATSEPRKIIGWLSEHTQPGMFRWQFNTDRAGVYPDTAKRIITVYEDGATSDRDARDAALRALVEQIERCNPIDDHGHRMTMNIAYIKAKELL